jgi:hypothetical protein
MKNQSFGQAIEALKQGKKVAREGWNGKGMFLVFVPGTKDVTFSENTPYSNSGIQKGNINPHVDMYTAQGDFQPGWLANQTDMLSNDWCILD